MKITKSQLRKIIKEEVSKVLLKEEESSFMDAYRKAMSKDDPKERMKMLQMAYSIAEIEGETGDFLNKLKSDGHDADHERFSTERDPDMVHHTSPHTHHGSRAAKEEYEKELAKRRASLLKKGKIQPPTKEKPWPT